MTHQEIETRYAQVRLARKAQKYATGHGIVHSGGTVPAQVERSAVSFALQRAASQRGVPFQAGEVDKLVGKYTGALRTLAQSKAALAHPKLGPDVQAYAQTASRLSVPEDGTDDLGRHTLSNAVTQPGIEHLAGLLARKGQSGKSLLEHADELLARSDKNHVPLSNYFEHAPTPTKMEVVPPTSGFIDLKNPPEHIKPQLRKDAQAQAESDVANLGVKPATGETVKPADLRRKLPRVDTLPYDVVDDGHPLPLADVPDAKSDRSAGHHELIASMVFKKTPAAEIVRTVAEKHGVTPATARRQLKTWLDNQRLGLSRAEPHKLARKPVDPGKAYLPQKPIAVGELYGKVDPRIAGTRLAKHLMEIIRSTDPGVAPGGSADGGRSYAKPGREGGIHSAAYRGSYVNMLAKAALRGEKIKGLNGDIFTVLGRNLGVIGHAHEKTYNWHTMNRSLKEHEFMEKFVRKHIAGAAEILDGEDHAAKRELWGKIAHHYARDEQSMERGYADPDSHAKFWARLRAEHDKPFSPLNDKKFNDATIKRLTQSMYRHYTMADERDTTRNVDGSKQRAGTKNDWREPFDKYKANPATKHMKFSRLPGELRDEGDFATAAIFARMLAAQVGEKRNA